MYPLAYSPLAASPLPGGYNAVIPVAAAGGDRGSSTPDATFSLPGNCAPTELLSF